MEEVKLTCAECGEETSRQPKAPPKNAREAKQMLFHCKACGAINLRDGTAIPRSFDIQEYPEEIQEEPNKKTSGLAAALLALLGIVSAAITAAAFLKRPKTKPEEKSSESPQGSYGPIR